ELLVGHAVELRPHVEPRGELPRIALGVPAVVGEDGAAPLVDDRDGADFVRLLLVEALTLEVDDSFTHAAGSSRPHLPRNPLGLAQRGGEDVLLQEPAVVQSGCADPSAATTLS